MPTPANSTNHTYCLSTNLTTFDDSEAYCNTLGGHLASWNSLEEQTEVGGSCSLPHSTQPSHFLLPGGSHVHASSLAASVPAYLTRVHMTCTHGTGAYNACCCCRRSRATGSTLACCCRSSTMCTGWVAAWETRTSGPTSSGLTTRLA